jgi:hypothetical protein
MTAITFFILIKGAKGASFISAQELEWIKTHTETILLINFFFWMIVLQVILWFTKINILKPIVLVGTFALALAFSANDLVNFIGVPLAGLSSYVIASNSNNPLELLMEALKNPVQTKTLLLIAAGAIMVVTLWFSKKAQSVTKTEVNLGRQLEGIERFESSLISRIIVRMNLSLLEFFKKVLPKSLQKIILKRLDNKVYKKVKSKEGITAKFDLLRAAVNLMVASILISIGTNLKLPLSTTYVTFMVAMGTSLSDRAWGRESAVYRINGVLTVIGGWFFTAFMAFTVSAIFATIIYFAGIVAILILAAFAGYVLYRTHLHHKIRAKEEEEIEAEEEKELLEDVTPFDRVMNKVEKLLDSSNKNVTYTFDALFVADRKKLKKARKEAKKIKKKSDSLVGDVFKTLQASSDDEIKDGLRYGKVIASIREISSNLRSLAEKSFEHIDNNHSKPAKEQIEDLKNLDVLFAKQIKRANKLISKGDFSKFEKFETAMHDFQKAMKNLDKNQASRIKKGTSSARSSLLYLGLLSDTDNLSHHTANLVEALKDILESRKNLD